MPYSDPGAVTTGTTITSTWGNAVRNAEQYLANPPSCRVYHNAAQSIPHITVTALTFNTERFDTDTMHDTVTNNSRITIKTAGLYEVSFMLTMATNTDWTLIATQIRLNGATPIAKNQIGTLTVNDDASQTLTTLYKFAVNDYVEGCVYHRNAAAAARNTLVQGNSSPEMAAVWVGLG